MIGKPIALATHAKCELVRRNRMTSRSPSLTTGVRTGDAANVLPIIAEIQKSGAKTLRAIADALNARGIPTP